MSLKLFDLYEIGEMLLRILQASSGLSIYEQQDLPFIAVLH